MNVFFTNVFLLTPHLFDVPRPSLGPDHRRLDMIELPFSSLSPMGLGPLFRHVTFDGSSVATVRRYRSVSSEVSLL